MVRIDKPLVRWSTHVGGTHFCDHEYIPTTIVNLFPALGARHIRSTSTDYPIRNFSALIDPVNAASHIHPTASGPHETSLFFPRYRMCVIPPEHPGLVVINMLY